MSRFDELLSAINLFQAACEGEEDLRHAMRRLNDVFKADGLALESRTRPSIELTEVELVNIDTDNFAKYMNHYSKINPRASIGIDPRHHAISHDAAMGLGEEFERSEYYNDYLSRLNLRYFLSIRIDPSPDIFTVLAFQFIKNHGPVEAEDLKLAALALPLLNRGMARRWQRIFGADSEWVIADMQRRLGLTPAEAALAIDLVKGLSVVQHSDLRQVTKNTAYTHFARLKDKVGVRHFGELIVALCVRYSEFARAQEG